MYNNFCRVKATRAALAQAVAHLIGSEEVTSSNLVSSLKGSHRISGAIFLCFIMSTISQGASDTQKALR